MIYLDNAATTFPKPDCVIDAMTDFLKTSTSMPRPISVELAAQVGGSRDTLDFSNMSKSRP